MSFAGRVSRTPDGSSPQSSLHSFSHVTHLFYFFATGFLWSFHASQLLIFAASLNETTSDRAGSTHTPAAATAQQDKREIPGLICIMTFLA